MPGPPTRPRPDDFADMFVLLGWEAIEEHYDASQRTIKRWMRETGERELIERRRGYLRKVYASRGFATAMGRKPAFITELPAGDPALAFMPIRRLRRPYRAERLSSA